MFCSCHQTKSETAFLVFFNFLQDLKKWRKTIKVKWLGMYSAVLLQTMILWMIWWVLACIDCGKIGDVLPCTFFYMLIDTLATTHARIPTDLFLSYTLFLEWSILMWLVEQVSNQFDVYWAFGTISAHKTFFLDRWKRYYSLFANFIAPWNFYCCRLSAVGSCLSAGDVAFRVYDTINSVSRRALQHGSADGLENETKIYVCDINRNMLNIGKRRAIERGANASFLKPLGTVVFCFVD